MGGALCRECCSLSCGRVLEEELEGARLQVRRAVTCVAQGPGSECQRDFSALCRHCSAESEVRGPFCSGLQVSPAAAHTVTPR